MATTLTVGDIAVVHYDSSTGAFTFAFLRDVEAGTVVNFTDNGWLASGGFRPGEGTVTYTAPAAIAAGTIVTLTGLDLDPAGDQIIAYQGDPATPTVLHLIDFGDDNNTAAGDATNANTTALPPGFTLGVNAVAVAFDSSLYAGPTSGSSAGLFAALNNSANWLEDDAQPVSFFFDAKPVIDLDADNSTHLGDDYEGTVTPGGPAVPIADTDVDIDDFDDVDLLAAEIRVIGFDVRDLLAVNGALPPGIVALPFRTPDGILRLEGRASHADYEAAIRQVVFSTTDAVGDLKRIHVSVFDGQGWSHNATAFIEITQNLTAAPPGLDLDANNSTGGGADATATYTAGGAAIQVTDVDIAITADNPTIESATITILGWSLHAGDVLSIAGTLPAGITASSYNPITGVITLSGAASPADYQTALRQVVYSSTLGAPSTADRGIQVTVTDAGGLISNLATMYMHVVIPPPNSAPVLDLDANNSTTSGTSYLTGFTEGGAPVAIVDVDVFAFDSDSPNLASATITLTNPQTDDVLTFDGTPPIGIAVLGSGTSVITLTGDASSGSYQLALQQIKFSNSSIDPSNVTRTIEVVVSDGTSNSNIATALVQVEAVNNSAPVIDLDPDDSTVTTRTTFRTTFTENGAPLPIADTDTTITDLDSPTLVFATITLANQHPGDLLTVALPLPGGIVASPYNPGTGVLTLTGTATLDDYEVALQQVLYSNTSDNPDTVDRLIEVVVNDGVNTSNVAAAVISVVPVNDAPAVVLEGTVYVENAATVTLDPLAALSDPDDTDLSQVVIRITTGATFGDFLTVGGLTGGTVDGITFIWDTAEHAMVMTGASSVLNYQNLLRTVGFHSISDNPTNFGADAIRILTWNVSDGEAVTTTTTTLDILAVNDAPQATVAATASYTENAAPVALSPAAIAADVDNLTLVAGEVRIVAGAVDGDLLTVNGLQSGTFVGIEFSYDPVLRSLSFTHPTLIADYEAFLEAVAFSSASDNPTNSGLNPTRTLSWFVFDGDALSNLQTTVVSITALEDPTVNTVPGPQSVNEDTTLAIAGVSVADADNPPLTTTLTVASGTLNVTAGAGVTNNGTGAVTITGTAAEINTALAGLSYRGNLNFNGPDTLTVTTTDGVTAPDIDTIAITVLAVADPPVNTVPGPQSVNEDATLAISGVSVADPDVGTLTTTVTVTGGTLNVTAGPGVSNNGTAAVTITGTATQINTALAGLSYHGNLNFNGPETLTVTTGDGTAQDLDTVAITVNAVNDLPVNTVPAAQSVNEDTLLPIAGVSVVDVDGGPLTTTLTVTSGTLNVTAGAGVTGNSTAVVTITGTAAQINTALAGLSYRGNLNFNGPDTLTVTTGDGTAQDLDTVAITVNPVNDPPALPPPKILRVNEDSTLLIPGVSVSDVDSLSLTTVMEVADGIINVTAGTGATVDGNGTATITITGTVSQTNAALAGLSYRGNLNFNGEDFLFLVTRDEAFERGTTILVIVEAVNDAPANTVPAAQSVSEDTLLPIAGVSVADVDGGTLTTTLTATSGTLSVIADPGVSNNGTAAVTITGTAAAINAALASLAYTGNLNFNGADTVTVSTSDGALGDTDTIGITVDPENDAPVNTVPGAQSVNEDTNGAIFGLAVADVDAGGATLTATLSVAHGTLTIAAVGGAAVSGSGTGTVTLTGTASQINATLAAANNVVYRGLQDYDGPDTLTLTTGDGGNTGSGGVLTDIDTVAITVNPVNDRPVLDLDANNSSGAAGTDYTTTFTEGGAAVAVADLDDLITDVDNPNLASATVTLANSLAGDLLSVVGTLPVGITASAYDPSTGVLTLSGAATLGAYQAALRQITFSNSSPIPSATDRIVNIAVNDGTASSIAAHAFIHVVPVDTAPALDLDANDSSGAAGADYTALFIGGGAAVPIADADTLVADADSANIVSATITLTNAEATDLLLVNGALPTGITASPFDPATGILTLSGSAPLAAYQTALHQIEYGSSDPNTITATRVIEVVVNDGVKDSDAAFSLIQIVVAAPPTLDLDADDSTSTGADYATTFTEGGAAVPVADIDVALGGATFASATITLTNPLADDLLSVNGLLPTGIAASAYDPGTGVITLSGAAPAVDYQTALRQVVYANGSDNPSIDDRVITVVMNDGVNDSNTATAIINVAAVNDPPSLSVVAAASYTENGAAVTVSPVVTVLDPDSPNLTIGIAAITAGLNPGDVLTVGGLRSGTLGPIRFNWAPSLNELIVTGAGSAADYEALFQSVRFLSDSDDPTNAGADTTRTISWAVFDGTNTAVSTTTLTITAVNDAAVAQGGGASGNEDKPIAGTLVATDTDSITLTYSLATPATHGSVALSPDGSYIYTPDADFNGSDSFAFVANDGVSDSNVATVTLTVNPVGDTPGQGPGGVPVPDPIGFDAGFYLYTNPDVAAAGVDPLDHFNTFGWREGRNPSAAFDTDYYLAQNPDVAAAGVNPLEHFNIFGWREGRDPSAYFDTSGYLEHYADVAAAGVNPLQHYQEFGWYEGRDPSLGFDTTQYLAVYTDVAAAHVDPLGHFLYSGIREGRSPFGDGFWE